MALMETFIKCSLDGGFAYVGVPIVEVAVKRSHALIVLTID